MSQRRDPLKVISIISAGVRLYRDNFKTYLGISLLANLWLLAPFLVLILFDLLKTFLVTILPKSGDIPGFLWFLMVLMPFWLIFFAYCAAQFLTNTGVISRLAFSLLINKPETVRQARQELKPRRLQFILNHFLYLILFFFIFRVWQIIQVMVFYVPASFIPNPKLQLMIQWVGYLFFVIGFSWFYARLFFPEVPLAIEKNLQLGDAIIRSWKLTSGFAWSILFIIFLVILLTMPLYLLSGIPLIFAAVYAMTGLFNQVSSLVLLSIINNFIKGAIIIYFLLNIAILPFWQTLKSVIYYHLYSQQDRHDTDF
ncbi:hypothetical protein [Gloeothece verrucosa]|uniref:Glycerophosphoryl diester phosphodiesterase membrane domain-containing protein n=1 Tax=Gloeothece verrucosa (strain PCC 7822) TaxID=497965 RepID=E0UEU4_GLOV7|nr:hypothetical protein [Gloeothece verrucosa]ADN13074.1 conserved hypothetical protein [Gloeothece verrucosa PCC 7822]